MDIRKCFLYNDVVDVRHFLSSTLIFLSTISNRVVYVDRLIPLPTLCDILDCALLKITYKVVDLVDFRFFEPS